MRVVVPGGIPFNMDFGESGGSSCNIVGTANPFEMCSWKNYKSFNRDFGKIIQKELECFLNL